MDEVKRIDQRTTEEASIRTKQRKPWTHRGPPRTFAHQALAQAIQNLVRFTQDDQDAIPE